MRGVLAFGGAGRSRRVGGMREGRRAPRLLRSMLIAVPFCVAATSAGLGACSAASEQLPSKGAAGPAASGDAVRDGGVHDSESKEAAMVDAPFDSESKEAAMADAPFDVAPCTLTDAENYQCDQVGGQTYECGDSGFPASLPNNCTLGTSDPLPPWVCCR